MAASAHGWHLSRWDGSERRSSVGKGHREGFTGMRTVGAAKRNVQEVARTGDAMDRDWELVERVAAGEEVALEEIVRTHEERLLALCHRLLGSRAAAEDAVQEVFLKLYRRAGRLRPRGRLYTWLYRVATNLCLNRLRRRRIVRFVPLTRRDEADDDLDPADPRADPERALAARERWRETERLVARLPPNQRVVLVLARYERLSYREIAETLGITEGAVESRLVRAMRNLRGKAQESPARGVSP